jgi:hypothetical protein
MSRTLRHILQAAYLLPLRVDADAIEVFNDVVFMFALPFCTLLPQLPQA